MAGFDSIVNVPGGAHFYYKDGTPCYEVPCKSRPGEMRKTTLADARKLDLVPSVTTGLSVVAKHGVDRWKASQYVLGSLTYPVGNRQPEECVEDCIEQIHAMMDAARDLGSAYHAVLEAAVRDYAVPVVLPDGVCRETVQAALDEAAMLTDMKTARPEVSFARGGYGGKIDVLTNDAVIDWKTQATRPGKPVTYYDEWCWQLAAYIEGYDHYYFNDIPLKGISIVLSTTEPGRVDSKAWTRDELDHGWDTFWAALTLWRQINRF